MKHPRHGFTLIELLLSSLLSRFSPLFSFLSLHRHGKRHVKLPA